MASKAQVAPFRTLLDEARKGMHPKGFWNYGDETEGYTFQKLFFRQGGHRAAGLQTGKVLLRWAHEEPFFSLKEQLAQSRPQLPKS